MPKFTEEQQQAIDLEGKNILVSAGAGSGKTAVLTERVLRKIKQGVSISQLLILTFTNKAALEMKERIRKKLQAEHLADQLDLLDSSYITTFDAFSLTVVKKYADVLKVPKDIKIAEASLLTLKKQELLTEILEEYYEQPTPAFEQLITYFCLKDDATLQTKLLALDDQLELELDKQYVLENYAKNYYQEANLHQMVEEYDQLVKQKHAQLLDTWQDFASLAEGKYYEKVEAVVAPLISSTTYEEIKKNNDITLPRLPAQSAEELKACKQQLADIIKELQSLTLYENHEQMKTAILKTKPWIEVMLEILLQLNKRLQEFQRARQLYTFMDIEKLAIKAVSEHEEIRIELRDSFQEILIDEYQDTNDIQETFIQYIANHNVYMVGDIKQSIYRFRNANPMIFKEKYDRYKQQIDGVVIDLAKNFRSRREVIADINDLFSCIMDDAIGGAAYQEGHAMIFGNTTYEEKAATDDCHHLSLLSYDAEDKSISTVEKEAFIIADDIKQKMQQHYLVYDKDQDELRPIEYRDFVILMDRSTDFVTYRQIFEYLGLPLTLWQDEKASSSVDLYLLKNMFVMTAKMASKQYDTDFLFAFTSLARSFLFALSDEEIYHYVVDRTFEESSVFKVFLPMAEQFDVITPTLFLDTILQAVNYQEKLVTIGNVRVMSYRMEYFYQLVQQLEASGYTMDMVTDYFKTVTDRNFEIKLSMSKPETNSIKMMTIHTSKGLEYPICYFAGFTKKFNDSDFKQSVLYDKTYGIIMPDMETSQDLITKTLLLHHLKIEDIGEKIRLLYVALTRAREKMILVLPEEIEAGLVGDKVDDTTRLAYTSFESTIKSVYSLLLPYKKSINEIPNFSKDYLLVKNPTTFQHTKQQECQILPSIFEEKLLEKKTFAKQALTEGNEALLQMGRQVHQLLERCNLITKEMPIIADDYLRKKVEAFLHSTFLKQHQQDRFFQEYEFYFQNGSELEHGIIDLLIVGDEQAVIVDYKLKNTVDDAYQSQLAGYKKFVENQLQVPVSCYLYSILDEKFTLVRC